jgi:hexokinase
LERYYLVLILLVAVSWVIDALINCKDQSELSTGAIFGTGTNGAYLERVSNITKLKNDPAAAQGGDMIINTEWGAFNNSRSQLPTTVFDNVLDRQSINPHFQAFEKFISGMYLGEITRNVLLSLVDAAPRPILFSGQSSKELNEHYGLDTAVMSAVEEAWEGKKDDSEEIKKEEVEVKKEHGDLSADNAAALSGTSKTDGSSQAPLTPTPAPSGVTTTASASTTALKPAGKLPPTLSVPELFKDGVKDSLDHLDKSILTRLERVRQVIISQLHIKPEHVSLRDAAVVRFVVGLVSTRAAALSACAVATVAVQTGAAKLGKSANKGSGERQKFAVGVDGSLIQFYPNFEVHLRESLRALVGEEVERSVEIGMAKDGSGVGGMSPPGLSRGLSSFDFSGTVRPAGYETTEEVNQGIYRKCTLCITVLNELPLRHHQGVWERCGSQPR